MVSILLGEQRYFEETLPISELKDLLDSGSMSTAKGQAERIRGLKWLMAMISKGTDVSRFFPDVIRNIMTPNLELKKLVYMYVLHYADHDEASRSAALLSINAFQRDLSEEHELIRGLALRTLTSIRVDDIQGVQALAVRTCARDASPYVRKIAANAVIKICLNLNKTNPVREQFEDEVLGKLLLDPSPSVMGSAAGAMLQVCPERYDLINAAFDRVINVLTEVDEWGQIAILELLNRFARYSFTNPVLSIFGGTESDEPSDGISASSLGNSAKRSQKHALSSPQNHGEDEFDDEVSNPAVKKKWQGVVLAPVVMPNISNKRRLPTKTELDSFFDDTSSSIPAVAEVEEAPRKSPISSLRIEEPDVVTPSSMKTRPMQEKHKRLLKAALPLLKSRNSGVVVAAASTMWYCGQRSKNAMQRVAQAMVRLIKSPYREVRYCALRSVLPMIKHRSGPFIANLPDFFVNPSLDAPFVRNLKLEIMCYLVRESTLLNVLRELETYVTHPNENFAAQAVRTVGSIALQHSRSVARDCLGGLAGFIASDVSSKRVLEESIMVARDVLGALKHPVLESEERAILLTLLRGFERIPQSLTRARYCLLWLARDFYGNAPDEAEDIMRSVAASFCEEAIEVKLQALSLASIVHDNEAELARYVLELGEFDSHFDVRDWARFLSKGMCKLIPEEGSRPLIEKDHGVAEPRARTSSADPESSYRIDTLSFMVGQQVPGYASLPEWAVEPRLTYGSKKPSGASSESSSSDESSSTSSSSSEEESSSSEQEEEEEEEQQKATAAGQVDAVNGKGKHTSNSVNEKGSQKPLGVDATAAHPIQPTAPPSLRLPDRQVEFKPLLSHVRGQGMQIDHWFSRDSTAEKGWTSVRLRIANKLDDRPISRIRIEASDVVQPLFEGIEMLASGFYRDDVKLLIAFRGHWRAPVKFIVSAEEIGKMPVEIRAPPGELLVPDNSLSLDDFYKVKKQLVGMNETSAKLANPHAHDVIKRVLDVCNFYPLPPSVGAQQLLTESLWFRFAARRSDTTASKVLLEINVGLDGMLDLSLHCEDALAGQSLLDELKTAFSRQ